MTVMYKNIIIKKNGTKKLQSVHIHNNMFVFFFIKFTNLLMIIVIRRTFIKCHKSRNIHSEGLYMSTYTCVVEL